MLVAGEAVEKDDGGMRLRAGGEQEEAHDAAAVRVDDGFDVLRGRGGVGLGVGGEGSGLLGWRRVKQERGAGEEESERREFESAHRQPVSDTATLETIRLVRFIR